MNNCKRCAKVDGLMLKQSSFHQMNPSCETFPGGQKFLNKSVGISICTYFRNRSVPKTQARGSATSEYYYSRPAHQAAFPTNRPNTATQNDSFQMSRKRKQEFGDSDRKRHAIPGPYQTTPRNWFVMWWDSQMVERRVKGFQRQS